MIKNLKGITKIMQITVIVTIFLIAIFAGVIYYSWYGQKIEEVPKKETIRIGFSQPLSGKYAREGRYVLDGIFFWKKQVDAQGGIFVKEYGRKLVVDLVYYDDMSDKDTAIKLAEKLILEDKVDIAFAPYTSFLAYAVTPVFDKHKMFNIALGSTSDAIFERGLKYTVQVMPLGSTFEIPSAEMAYEFGIRKVAIIYATDESSTNKAAHLKKYFEGRGAQVLVFEGYPVEVTDLTPLILKIKQSGAEALMGGGFLPDALLIMRQLKENNVYLKFIDLFVAPALVDFYNALKEDAEGVCGISVWEPSLRWSVTYGLNASEFAREFKKIFGYDPPYQSALGYFAGLLTQKLIEKTGTLNSDALRQAANTLEMTTLLGKWKIEPETGKQIGHKGVVIQWQGGKRVVAWPPEAAEAKPLFPKPPWS
jgi:branched-chain amino acid transport system substrate-binding protein